MADNGPVFYDLQLHKGLTVNGVEVACPGCGATEELTVFGHQGGPATFMCACRNQFQTPHMDPVELMALLISQPGAGLEVRPGSSG
ncbi:MULTISPECIES: hypothetical protein [unclassified Streptomyces]|uniref:hypothetical protein n=1 Tax=unclassified Streptomyces TaxID=2593676 RepID=UPI00081F66A1|nr:MULTISPECIES: hypothetical protein [unclassified Streptomyces]MYZ40130.1 hypothetical protein [Streptomyces sp. SID4917]SCG06703.1 hypothetical protein GA0115259_110512 [Streptomyces sp. MnatMP-M17]